MKRKISYLIIFIITFIVLSNNVLALTDADIHSREALLVNLNTDEVLYHKNTVDEHVPMASLTKLMTYAIVVEEIDDLENTMITVPKEIIDDMVSRNASRAGLKEGYTYSALDLLYGAMLPSGCDASETLAWFIGQGDTSIFVNKMNAKAQELGMNDTVYIDAHGIGTISPENISIDNLTTEEDLYKIVKYVYNLPYFKEIISTEYYTLVGKKDDSIEESFVRNTNYLIGEYSGGSYYNPYAIGGKTGTLSVAGKCLVTIFKKGNNEYVAITLGIPGEHTSTYDYHLTDHNKLFDYIIEEKENNITIDIGPGYRSLEVGKKLKIDATTSSNTSIKWTSSDDSVATVDENGIVTGISLGQAKISAETESGNIDYSFVSVGFYNGVHIKYSYGPPNQNNGWDPVDFSILKNNGFDYVVIRAGYGDSTTDNTFYKNFESAANNSMNIGIWFEGYAKTVEEARNEANNLISILNNISNNKDKINLPVFYNLLNTSQNDPQILVDIAKEFNTILKENGYELILELGKTKLTTMNLEELEQDGINISVIYRSIPPELNTKMTVNDIETAVWNYKTNAYLGKEIGNSAVFSIMYMSYKKIDTIHEEYVEEIKEEEKKEEQNNNEIKDDNINKTIVKEKKKDTSNNDIVDVIEPIEKPEEKKEEKKEEQKKEEKPIEIKKDNDNKNNNIIIWIVPLAIISTLGFIIIFLKRKKMITNKLASFL